MEISTMSRIPVKIFPMGLASASSIFSSVWIWSVHAIFLWRSSCNWALYSSMASTSWWVSHKHHHTHLLTERRVFVTITIIKGHAHTHKSNSLKTEEVLQSNNSVCLIFNRLSCTRVTDSCCNFATICCNRGITGTLGRWFHTHCSMSTKLRAQMLFFQYHHSTSSHSQH